MKITRDIQSLSVFKRDTSKFIKQLKKTREPIILTVNGKAEMVVLDARSYEDYIQERERLDTLASIRRGIADARAGRVTEAEDFFAEFEKEHGLPSD
ncbi:MAG: type II toxin-antitoxin system Phd/YefM family antitoxin [Acidobacteriota bacterium]